MQDNSKKIVCYNKGLDFPDNLRVVDIKLFCNKFDV